MMLESFSYLQFDAHFISTYARGTPQKSELAEVLFHFKLNFHTNLTAQILNLETEAKRDTCKILSSGPRIR